jgi:hypothetical protein
MILQHHGFIVAQVYWESPQWWPAVLGGTLVLMLAIAWLYPRQLRNIGWPWRLTLLLLRTAALLALLISLLQPMAVRPATPGERGAVVVIVDRSRSMSIVDNTRSNAECVAIADALGRLPPGLRAPGIAGFQGDLNRLRTDVADVRAAQDDLDFALISGREIGPHREQLSQAVTAYSDAAKAASARTQGSDATPELRRALAELANVPDPRSASVWRNEVPKRLSNAADALTRYQAEFDQHLFDVNPQVHQAATEVAGLSRYALAEQAILDHKSGLLTRLPPAVPVTGYALAEGLDPIALTATGAQPDGWGTNLTGGIAAAAAMGRARAIVLFSDGRQVSGDDRAIAGLTPGGVPIFTVGVAAAAPPRDLAFGRVSVPAGGFVGDTITVRGEIRHEGIDGIPADVTLSAPGMPDLVRSVDLKPGGPAVVEFPVELKPEQAGALKFTLSIGKVNGEVTDENNSIERWMKVLPQRIRVAVWSGAPTWDDQELSALLARRGEIELSRQIVGKDGLPLSMSPEEILQQDVIVLCDVPVAGLSARQWDAVVRLVTERGGSVIMEVGEHLPAEYSSTAATSSLLPFAPPLKPRFRLWPGEQPAFRFVPNPDAGASDVLRLSNDPQIAWQRWQELPPVYRFLELPNMREQKLRPLARALLVEADSGAPVLVERPIGAGRSFLLCTNETWRWRLKVGGRDQDRFWRQLIQYAAQPPYFANNGGLALDADQIAVLPNTLVHVRGRIEDSAGATIPACTLRIMKDGKPYDSQSLAAVGPAGAGRYEGTVSLPAGIYQLILGEGAAAVAVPLRVQRSEEAEMADLSGDNAFLRRLAESSGGEFFPLDQIGRLPDRVASAGDRRTLSVDLHLWDSPYLFVFVLGCLAAEWALRKQVGLA